MAARESQLGALHEKVATVMVRILDQVAVAQDKFDDMVQNPDLQDLVLPEVSPAMLGAMTKFLSDNKITCVPEESEQMSELARTLAAKRTKRRAIGNVVAFEAED